MGSIIVTHVFISYRHNDTSYASKIADSLEKYGVQTWQDSKIKAGEDWVNAIKHYLEQAKCLIIVLSPKTGESEWVNWELEYAQLHKKPIIPVLVQGKKTESLMEGITKAEIINLKNDYESGIQAIIQRINEIKQPIKHTNGFTSKKHEVSTFRELIETQDKRILLEASKFNTYLSSLVMLEDPEPDYMGIQDKSIVLKALEQQVEIFPESFRLVLLSEQHHIQNLLIEHRYEEARQRIYGNVRLISKFMKLLKGHTLETAES